MEEVRGRAGDRVARRNAVRLFAEERELLQGVPDSVKKTLSGSFFADVVAAPLGEWEPDVLPQEAVAGLLVLDGLVARQVLIAGTRNAELIGPGDILTSNEEFGHSIERATCFEVVIPARLAILDYRFVALTSKVPQLVPLLLQRVGMRAHSLATHYALSKVRPLSTRLHLLLWQLADRWGIRRDQKVVIPVPLTHDLISRMIGADRAAISRAASSLRADGLLERGADRSWVLLGGPPLEDDTAPLPIIA